MPTAADTDDVGAPPPTTVRRAWLLSTTTTMTLGLVALVTSPLAARFLGPEGRGRLVVLQVMPQFLADLAAIGLPFAIVHFGAKSSGSAMTLMRWSIRPALIGSAVTFTIGQCVASSLTSGVDADTRLLRIYLFLCPVVAFTTVAQEMFRGSGAFGAWSAIALARGLSWPAAVVIGIARPEPDLPIVVYSHLALSVAVLVGSQIAARRRFRHALATPHDGERAFVAYGIQSIASTIPRSASAKTDQLLMTTLVSKSDLGLYAAAVGWGLITIPAMRGLANITMPLVSGAATNHLAARARQVVLTGLAGGALLTVVCVPATLLLWVPVYGDDYRPALTAAVVMIPAAILLEYGLVLSNVLRSLGNPMRVAVLDIAVVTLSVIGVLAVIPVSTVLGPAIVSLLAYAVAALLYINQIARAIGAPIRSMLDAQYLPALPRRRRPGRA